MAPMTGDCVFHIQLNDRATSAFLRVADLFHQLGSAFRAFGLAAARAFRIAFAPLHWLRSNEPRLLAAEQDWQGIARRHAERPPTRGYWVRRCTCAACCLRRVLRVE